MSKRVKRTTVRRAYDSKKKSESTAGLMALRIILVLVILAVVTGTVFYIVHEFAADSEQEVQTQSEPTGEFYQQFSDEQSKQLLEYCNNSISVSKYYDVETSEYDGVKVNKLMYESLKKMIDAAAEDGIKIDISKGYMSYDECELEYKSVLLKLEDEGNSPVEAEILARKIFPNANNNEYRTGMIIKVSELESSDFSKTDAYAWLYKNGLNYGFINRYTEEKESSTGLNEDLTVYRFVGTDNAKKMRSFNMSLEEYSEYCSYH